MNSPGNCTACVKTMCVCFDTYQRASEECGCCGQCVRACVYVGVCLGGGDVVQFLKSVVETLVVGRRVGDHKTPQGNAPPV